MKLRELTLLLIAAVLALVAAGVACHLWGVQSDPCAIDAPMERAHCRAMEEER